MAGLLGVIDMTESPIEVLGATRRRPWAHGRSKTAHEHTSVVPRQDAQRGRLQGHVARVGPDTDLDGHVRRNPCGKDGEAGHTRIHTRPQSDDHAIDVVYQEASETRGQRVRGVLSRTHLPACNVRIPPHGASNTPHVSMLAP